MLTDPVPVILGHVRPLVELRCRLDLVLGEPHVDLLVVEVDPRQGAGREEDLLPEDPRPGVDDEIRRADVVPRFIDVTDRSVRRFDVETLQIGHLWQDDLGRPEVDLHALPPPRSSRGRLSDLPRHPFRTQRGGAEPWGIRPTSSREEITVQPCRFGYACAGHLEDRYGRHRAGSGEQGLPERNERGLGGLPRGERRGIHGPRRPLWLRQDDGPTDDRRSREHLRGQLYDTIGTTYTVTRRTEPRIAARIWAALGDARTVLNVGAGTGSYEPPGRDVIAVEPSALMRAQRPGGAPPCVAAAAERLPFQDRSFDAAMAVSTIHHWQDPIAGLREMRRVARRVVVFTCSSSDTAWRRRFWLTRDYLPEVADFSVGRPSLTEQARAIGARMEPVLIPWDCADGFFEAYWRRPEAYLDDRVRRGVSVWARGGPDAERRAVRRLRDDLASGRWAERNRDLVDLAAAELGLRLLTGCTCR